MSKIKIGNQDIYGIYLGDQLIKSVYLGSNSIWQVIRGTLDNDAVTYEYIDGILTFRGTGIIPVIKDNTGDIAIQNLFNNREEVKEIIVEDSITEITVATDQLDGAFGCFNKLTKITLPFVGKNAKSEYQIYPFGSIFKRSAASNYYEVNSSIINGASSKSYYIPSLLTTVILNGGQYNKIKLYDNSFKNCTNIQTLVIPDIVQNIENGSLYGCRDLTSLTIPFIGSAGFKLKITNPGRPYSQTFGGLFGKSANMPIYDSNYYNLIQTAIYQGYSINDADYSQYESSGKYGIIPKGLKNLTVTGYDIPWYAFSQISNMPKLNLQTIKFTSTNSNYPTQKICYEALKTLGTNPKCEIFLPSSLEEIGYNSNSGTYRDSKIYFEGGINQWNALKNKYMAKDSSGIFFNNWQVQKYNAKPEDIKEVTTP